jgi:hypothetical protein
VSNPELKREIDPAWFQPQSNMNEYTQGYFKGREYERRRIVAILKDWDLNLRWDWVDIYRMIDDGIDYRQITMSPALLEDYKVRAAQIERETLHDAVKAFFDSIAPAHNAEHNPAHKAIEKEIMAILGGQAD